MVWERAEEFDPERFDLEGALPNETNTDFSPRLVKILINRMIWVENFLFIDLSAGGGPRKCVGDQFALLEAIVSLTVVLQHIDFKLVPDQNISMTTGATIHTTNVILNPYIPFSSTQERNTPFSLR
ncbi:hypothetical protein Leryth_015555 [Lithospermum erythrorhizon]|nr:hypothetical protein Leryth_015555 [Lithospermum erythrorhizon]